MDQHREQVASTLQRAVQTVLSRGLSDPRIKGLVSVTGILVAPDLAQATVMVSIRPAEASELTLKGLTAASRHIRSETGRFVQMRRIPQLHFKLDTSLKKQADIMAVLDEIRHTDETDQDTNEKRKGWTVE